MIKKLLRYSFISSSIGSIYLVIFYESVNEQEFNFVLWVSDLLMIAMAIAMLGYHSNNLTPYFFRFLGGFSSYFLGNILFILIAGILSGRYEDFINKAINLMLPLILPGVFLSLITALFIKPVKHGRREKI